MTMCEPPCEMFVSMNVRKRGACCVVMSCWEASMRIVRRGGGRCVWMRCLCLVCCMMSRISSDM